ncbi:MAG: site-specific DNA-methyltransferase, partial [Gammaproteobacteria bacterium]|nr:site-specific DNA-methyltransferase [Gammaproteobacteria bacterium]
EEDKSPVQVAYERRNRDLDPQLVWRGKDEQDWSDLIVQAPPLYVQEKLHPKALIDDLKRQTKARRAEAEDAIPDLFADFNGLPDKEAVTEFYQHDMHWSNRMISGDSLSVMASLAEREGLRGQVQCIYFDPPYGIKFNSNFQWSTTSRDVKDGSKEHVTREPEQVRAFRDTWKDGIHSYLTYLRDRLTVARDLLNDSGSIFVQIGDENVHRVRSLMEEVFGEDNCVSQIAFRTTTGRANEHLSQASNYLIWFAKDISQLKSRRLFQDKSAGASIDQTYSLARLPNGSTRRLSPIEREDRSSIPQHLRVFTTGDLTSSRPAGAGDVKAFAYQGNVVGPGKGTFKSDLRGLTKLAKAGRIWPVGSKSIRYVRYFDDYPVMPFSNVWSDTGTGSFTDDKVYVVQTGTKVIERCLLLTTDPGDLVLDPTCGSGTTAYVAEQWGRRWITIDTSRVAIALARSRLMGARYPYYLLSDSIEGQRREGEITGNPPKTAQTHGSIRQGFVYERVPHISLRDITRNAEIDVIWERTRPAVESAVADLNTALQGYRTPFKIETGGRAGTRLDFTAHGEATLPSGETAPVNGFMDWEVPRDPPVGWPDPAQKALARFWEVCLARQTEIDASIVAKADFEYLYDKPHSEASKVRVAGPFTVESLSPHITMAVGPDDELIDLSGAGMADDGAGFDGADDFASMILKNLRVAGVQQAHKEDRISFTSLVGWPGDLIGAEGRYLEGDAEKRAAIFIGPEFGTVSRPDLVAAAREAGDAGFDVLVACAFNYDAHSAEFSKLGRVPVLRARMNPDLHMAGDLATTGAGNLFVIFGEPDIQIEDAGKDAEGAELIRVKVSGVDVFKPQTGEVVSEDTDGIALWMLDTDYNEESFFVRHAYFLGANDPYKALKTTLKAEIDEEAWATLTSDISRPFPKPTSGRIAVKVINHLGDEVMKVFEAR